MLVLKCDNADRDEELEAIADLQTTKRYEAEAKPVSDSVAGFYMRLRPCTAVPLHRVYTDIVIKGCAVNQYLADHSPS